MAPDFGSTGPWLETLPRFGANLSLSESARSFVLISVVPVVISIHPQADHRMSCVAGVLKIAGEVSLVIGTVPQAPDRAGDGRIHSHELAFGPEVPMGVVARV